MRCASARAVRSARATGAPARRSVVGQHRRRCATTTTIFDPAVYGGHREIDIAMLALFGGLPDGFIESYEQVSPLAAGWRDRIALHQLYPLAAHACLFGGGYGASVASVLATLPAVTLLF